MTARLAPLAKRRRSSAEARLALTELLLVSDDLRECVMHALAWLGEHGAVEQALCLVVDPEGEALVGLGGYGVPDARVQRLRFRLTDVGVPVVKVFTGTAPRVVTLEGLAAGGRKGPQPFLAFPLIARAEPEGRPGVLLVAPAVSAGVGDAQWLAGLLGPKLLRQQSLRALRDAERRLVRERALLSTIINAVPDPILLTDSEGRIIVANGRAEALFGTTDGESAGRRRAVALNNMFFSSALGQTAIDTGEALRRELLLVDPEDGSDLLVELLSSVVTDAREGSGIVSILRNVTDLRRALDEIESNYRRLRVAEAEVRGERDRLDVIINSVADPIVVTDAAGGIVLMNALAERLYTAPPGPGAEAAQRVRTNDATLSSFVANVFLAGREQRYQGRFTLVDPRSGAVVPVEAVSGKIVAEHGEVQAVVTILHDRTEALEREQLYEQLKQASAQLERRVREATVELSRQNELLRRQALELEQASALKSQFLANMSHEFRTPLNAILGYTNMLLQGVYGELAAQQRRTLTRVDSNGRHLLGIIEDILDISKIEAGKMAVHPVAFGLPELIAEVTAEVEPLVTRSRVTVAQELEAGLPELYTDRGKVKQILINLLTNAIKFTAEGSVTVSCGWDRATAEILIAVTDTGIGIAESDQARIFEDFRQVDDSPTRGYGGAGLGLSISRRLATMLGGRITLQSKLGQGSTFTLVLPHHNGRRR